MPTACDLPEDIEALKRIVRARDAELSAAKTERDAAKAGLVTI